MVDSYIKENGGYRNIMNNMKADTYLMAKIRRLVEDAAEEEVKNIENANKDIEDIDDVEMVQEPEDEKDSIEVSSDTTFTAANITDIVAALNKSGLEIVKKGEDADNFQEAQPETDENKPDVTIEEPKLEEQPEATTDATPEEPASTTTATNSESDEEDELDKDLEVADKNNEQDNSEDSSADSETDDDTELDADLEVADKNNEDSKNDEDDDILDPDAVKVYDDEDIELDSEDEGDEDLDDIDDEELDDEDLDDEDESEDDSIDIDGDGDPDVGDIDEPEESVNVDPKKTMIEELEDEKEIKDAVELIRTRVADAEEAFIKRNQEDKQKIDELLSRISQNVATVEKISDDTKEAESAKKTV